MKTGICRQADTRFLVCGLIMKRGKLFFIKQELSKYKKSAIITDIG